MSDDYFQLKISNFLPIQFTMHQEKYSLKWGTYSDHLKSMMKDMMMKETVDFGLSGPEAVMTSGER